MRPQVVKAHETLIKPLIFVTGRNLFINETKRIEFLFEVYDRLTSAMFRDGKKKNKKMHHIPLSLYYSIFTIVFSFALVNFYSFIQEKRKIKTRLKNNESYILFWLDKNIKSIESQIKNIKDLHDKLKEWSSIELISYGIIKLPLTKLQQLSSLEIYSTFVINKKVLILKSIKLF